MAELPYPLAIGASALLAMLRREGGHWSVSQLVHHWQPTWSVFEVEQHLQALVRAGLVVSRPSLASPGRPSFSAQLMPVAMPVATSRHASRITLNPERPLHA